MTNIKEVKRLLGEIQVLLQPAKLGIEIDEEQTFLTSNAIEAYTKSIDALALLENTGEGEAKYHLEHVVDFTEKPPAEESEKEAEDRSEFNKELKELQEALSNAKKFFDIAYDNSVCLREPLVHCAHRDGLCRKELCSGGSWRNCPYIIEKEPPAEEPDDITLLPDFPDKKSNIVISAEEPACPADEATPHDYRKVEPPAEERKKEEE